MLFNRKPKPEAAPTQPASQARPPAPSAPKDPNSKVYPMGAARPHAVAVAKPETGKSVESVSRFGDLKFDAVLSGSTALGQLRVPKEHEYSVVAVSVGHKRAKLLYVPAALNDEVRRLIMQIKAALIADSVELEQDSQISPETIRAIVEQARAAQGLNMSSTDTKSQAGANWDSWVALAVKHGASDIRMECHGNRGVVRIRVDGEYRLLPDSHGGVYTAQQVEAAMAWGFTWDSSAGASSDGSWNRGEPRYTMTKPKEFAGGRKFALRYQMIPGYQGPAAVCRLLAADVGVPTQTFEELGYARSQVEMWEAAQTRAQGMIALAGKMGSGKTTAAKTFIDLHPGNDPELGCAKAAMASVEDPVEYPLWNTHQVQVQRNVSESGDGSSATKGVLTSLMRFDLDGGSLGEVRDSISAASVNKMVLSGHWALFTVHSGSAHGIIPRLIDEDIGMKLSVLTGPDIISLLVYQALVPKLCSCAIRFEDMDPSTRDGVKARRIFDQMHMRLRLPVDRVRWKNPKGCSECQQRGTRGRTVIAEMVRPDRVWLQHMRDGRDYDAIDHFRSWSDGDPTSDNMLGKTVFEHGLFRVLMGEVDPRRIEAWGSFDEYTPFRKGGAQ